MGNYLAIKGNVALLSAITQVNLENMVSEGSPLQKTTYYTIPFMESVQNRQLYGDRKYISDWLGLGGGKIVGGLAKGYMAFLEDEENVLKLIVMMLAQLCE